MHEVINLKPNQFPQIKNGLYKSREISAYFTEDYACVACSMDLKSFNKQKIIDHMIQGHSKLFELKLVNYKKLGHATNCAELQKQKRDKHLNPIKRSLNGEVFNLRPCNVCGEKQGSLKNSLIHCKGYTGKCTVSVHQMCYDIHGFTSWPWRCDWCVWMDNNDTERDRLCELCPNRNGALKRTNNNRWAHVICALYLPLAEFVDEYARDTIALSKIPNEFFDRKCYICSEKGRIHRTTSGACIKCRDSRCEKYFHVTCGQIEGLLCYPMDPKSGGFCRSHRGKYPDIEFIKSFKPIDLKIIDKQRNKFSNSRTSDSICSSVSTGRRDSIRESSNSRFSVSERNERKSHPKRTFEEDKECRIDPRLRTKVSSSHNTKRKHSSSEQERDCSNGRITLKRLENRRTPDRPPHTK